jgi:hypothetical protein
MMVLLVALELALAVPALFHAREDFCIEVRAPAGFESGPALIDQHMSTGTE